MKILLAIPTHVEVYKTLLKEIKQTYPIDLLILGIGMVNTTFTLSNYLRTSHFDFVVHGGIAGSFHSKLKIGNVVQVTKDIFADFGVYQSGRIIHASDIFNEQKWFNNEVFANVDLPEATAITINNVTACNERRMYYINQYKADIETMENAAVFFVCQKYKIPFISVRSVSNYVGDRNKQNWDISLAVENLWLTLKQIVRTIND